MKHLIKKFSRTGSSEAAQAARQARQRPLKPEQHEEIQEVCDNALKARWDSARVTQIQAMSQGYLVVRGRCVVSDPVWIMLDALTPLGYVVQPYTGSAVLVTGTDPLHLLTGRAREDIEEALDMLAGQLAYLDLQPGGER